MNDMVKLEVTDELIRPIIESQIAAAIAEQMGGAESLVETMVSAALNVGVNSDGKHTGRNYDDKYTFLEAVCGKAIREAAQTAVIRLVEENKPTIEKAVTDQLARAPKKTAAAIVAAFVESTSNKYAVKCDFSFNVKD